MTTKPITEPTAADKSRLLSPLYRGYLLVVGGAVCISFAAFFVKGAPIDPSMVAFYRLLFGAIPLIAVAFLQGGRLVPPLSFLPFIALAGLFFCVDLLSWHASIVILGPGVATILANFQVLFLALYGVVFLKDYLSWQQKVAMPLALAGMALLLGLHEAVLPRHIYAGVGFGLVSALFYSGYVLTLRQTQLSARRLPPVPNMAWVTVFCCMFVGMFCWGTGVSFAIPDGRTAALLAGLGVLCQALGWILFSKGLPLLPPFRAGLIMLAQPTLSFVWDVLFFGAKPGLVNVCGAVLAIAAIGMGIFSRSAAKSAEKK